MVCVDPADERLVSSCAASTAAAERPLPKTSAFGSSKGQVSRCPMARRLAQRVPSVRVCEGLAPAPDPSPIGDVVRAEENREEPLLSRHDEAIECRRQGRDTDRKPGVVECTCEASKDEN